MSDNENLVSIETKVFSVGDKILQIAAGTNSPKGGTFKDTGSCLHFSIRQNSVNVEWNSEVEGYEHTVAKYANDSFAAHRPIGVEINFAGDEECELAIEALKFAVDVLERQRAEKKTVGYPGELDKKYIFTPRQMEDIGDEEFQELNYSKWHQMPGPYRWEVQFDHNADTRLQARTAVKKAANSGAVAVFAISNFEGSLWVESSENNKCRKLDEDSQEELRDSLILKGATNDDIEKFLLNFPKAKEEFEGYPN